jgi:hypothetical protein
MGKIDPSDFIGKRFGRWTVLERDGTNHPARWLCRCECGTVKSVNGSNLARGKTQSCGCLHKEMKSTHGSTKTPTYAIWEGMIGRCTNPRNVAWKDYGGRGIFVCDRWRDFENFLADMKERPPGLTIERRDNDKGYSPQNCVWVSRAEQARNRRSNRLATLHGETLCVADWCDKLGVTRKMVYSRLRRGWSTEEAIVSRAGEKRKNTPGPCGPTPSQAMTPQQGVNL